MTNQQYILLAVELGYLAYCGTKAERWLRKEHKAKEIEREALLRVALSGANEETPMGRGIILALNNNHTIESIVREVKEALQDDETNTIKRMPAILGEGYEYIKTIINQ